MGKRGYFTGDEFHRLLAMAYVENGGNKVRAFMKVTGKNDPKKSYYNQAAHHFKKPSVQRYIGLYRRPIEMDHQKLIEVLEQQLEEARQLAMNGDAEMGAKPVASSAVQAVMGKAKLHGLDKQVVDHTSSDGTMSPTKDLSGEELRKELDKRGLSGLADAIEE